MDFEAPLDVLVADELGTLHDAYGFSNYDGYFGGLGDTYDAFGDGVFFSLYDYESSDVTGLRDGSLRNAGAPEVRRPRQDCAHLK